jgi:glucose/arabinose dehydrogenase
MTPRPQQPFRFRNKSCLAAILLVAAATASLAQTKFAAIREELRPENYRVNSPVVTACIEGLVVAADGRSRPNIANKGVAIAVGPDAAVCFDTDLLRMSAAWTSPAGWETNVMKVQRFLADTYPGWAGRLLQLSGVTFDGGHGGHPMIRGPQSFATKTLPGWADANGEFKDTRTEPYGPIPEAHARWNGLYLVGDKVVLHYTVLGTKVWEQPGFIERDGVAAFTRTFKVESPKADLTLLVCDVEGAAGKVEGGIASLASTTHTTLAGLTGAPRGAKLTADNGRITLTIPKGAPASVFRLTIAKLDGESAPKFPALLAEPARMADFAKGGPARFPQTVTTKGKLAASSAPDGAFVTDVLTAPVENPTHRRVRFGGMDFFSDGKRAALSTWDGDVWIVSGIDDSLEKLEWRLFATGGFETLGLKIVNDVIHTSGRDQITRYHDLNGDGEADFYENFNNQITSSPGFHEFVFDLHTDAQGNFYTAKAGPVRGGGRGFGGGGGNGEVSLHAGTVMKISKDGSKRDIFASGVRAPNGIGVGPNGEVTTGDNEGTWVPMCPINWVKPGAFLGVEDLAHGLPKDSFAQPLCWLDKPWDNSGGGQVWVTSDKWGPFKGDLLHTSYGQSALYLVMKEFIAGQPQGGVVRIPVRFTSSAMRPRFNPRDGQLYVAGLRGWQSNAGQETGFDRVRHTGKPVYSASGLRVSKDGVALTFTQPLDKSIAEDTGNWSGSRWNYKRTSNYGSPKVSVADPARSGTDSLDITAAKLSADGRTVTLTITDLKPVMQQHLNFKLKAVDGTAINQQVLHTINALP